MCREPSAQRSLREQNNVKQMVVAGSKGSFINISQMTACVGSRTSRAGGSPLAFATEPCPTLPRTTMARVRGFVENSYLRGLTPKSSSSTPWVGREGLIDTAVKTAETGYIQRRLVKAMEDLQVKYDTTVRNAAGEVIEFVYGEDGMDAVYIERQLLDTLRLDNDTFEQRYRVDPIQASHLPPITRTLPPSRA